MTGEPVIMVSKTVSGRDEVNMPVFVETETVYENVLVARVAPSVEDGTLRVIVEDGFTLYFRGERFESDPRTEWVVRGERYRSVGPSMPWGPGLSGFMPGTEVRVTRAVFVDGEA